MNNVIEKVRKRDCTGCETCAYNCPVGVISFFHDDAGFIYPHIQNKERCIHCGKCLTACPAFNALEVPVLKKRLGEKYFWRTDIAELKKSASGGLASYLYEQFIDQGGSVAGVSYDIKNRTAKFSVVNSLSETEKFRGSKYIQADKSMLYHSLSEALNKGKVLFVGLPCEVVAVKLLFRKFDNLYTTELICHGPTSSLMFDKYIDMIEKEKGVRVISYTSRYKAPFWKPMMSLVRFADGTESVNQYTQTELNAAFQMVKRESCNHCPFKNGRSLADLTIGDHHAAKPEAGDYNQYGTSICLVNSTKGEEMVKRFSESSAKWGDAMHKSANANRALNESLPRLPFRNRFVKIAREKGIREACNDRYIYLVLKYRKFPYRIRRFIERRIGKG